MEAQELNLEGKACQPEACTRARHGVDGASTPGVKLVELPPMVDVGAAKWRRGTRWLKGIGVEPDGVHEAHEQRPRNGAEGIAWQ